MDGRSAVHALPFAMPATPAERVAALFDAHHARLYRLARRLSSTSDDALDLVQETFLRAAQRPDAVPVDANAEEAWLVRVLVNLQRDAWRHQGVRQRHAADLHPRAPVLSDPEAAAVARATVWNAIRALPPRQRAIVILHELEGRDTAHIGVLLGISRITVRWHLARAHRHLARLVTNQGDAHARRSNAHRSR